MREAAEWTSLESILITRCALAERICLATRAHLARRVPASLRCVRDFADAQQAMAAAAEVAAAPKPASTLSSDLQAKIAANRAKALERRRAKASVAAAAAPNDTQTGVHDDMPSPEEEAEMMAAAATSKPAEEKQVLPTSSSSSFSPEDELDALMAEEEALGDLCVIVCTSSLLAALRCLGVSCVHLL